MAARQNGVLNKARVGINIADSSLSALSANATHMGEEMIRVAYQGEAVKVIPTATGVVVSPNFVQQATVTLALLKTSAQAQAYKSQRALDAYLGDFDVTWDSTALSTETIHNGVIQNIEEIAADGNEATVKVTLSGVVYINDNKL